MISSKLKIMVLLILFPVLSLAALVSCQSGSETPSPTDLPSSEPAGSTPSPEIETETAPSEQSAASTEPAEEATPAPTATITPLPTVTSPVPTPTSTTAPSPTPEAPPEAAFYQVQAGDTLFSIAESFNVSTEALALANGFTTTSEFSLIAGSEIQIPLCQLHEVVAGNTLAGIAQMCAVTLDELITANISALAPLGSLDSVPVGFTLIIPQESGLPEDLDCNIQPAREQVIEYLPGQGEGLFCLSQKFSVSTTTIIQANITRLAGDNVYGQTPLLIPPINGAIYQVAQDDVIAGLTLSDLAQWYEIGEDQILDWNGNPVQDPLREGQQLYLPGANLIFGPYQAADSG